MGDVVVTSRRSHDVLRWVIVLIGSVLAAYYTAQNETSRQLAIIDTREQTRWEEVQRRLSGIEDSTQRSEVMFQRVLSDWVRGVDRRTGEPLPLQSYKEQGGR